MLHLLAKNSYAFMDVAHRKYLTSRHIVIVLMVARMEGRVVLPAPKAAAGDSCAVGG